MSSHPEATKKLLSADLLKMKAEGEKDFNGYCLFLSAGVDCGSGRY